MTEEPIGEHGVIPPDEGDPVPRPVLEPEGDDEDDIESVPAEEDDEPFDIEDAEG
jgi:hypothetical protein